MLLTKKELRWSGWGDARVSNGCSAIIFKCLCLGGDRASAVMIVKPWPAGLGSLDRSLGVYPEPNEEMTIKMKNGYKTCDMWCLIVSGMYMYGLFVGVKPHNWRQKGGKNKERERDRQKNKFRGAQTLKNERKKSAREATMTSIECENCALQRVWMERTEPHK